MLTLFFRSRRHPLLLGTLLLTVTGLISRVIGFYYRIFLSRTIGAEGLGIYQLIFPVFTLCIALCSAGIQTAVSKFTAENDSAGENGIWLYAGILLSGSLSVLCAAVIYANSMPLAVHVLNEPRCASLLRIMSLSLPLASMHACINGYYYGLQKTAVPAASQLVEQTSRVLSVYLIWRISCNSNTAVTAAAAVWGIVCGELAGSLFSLSAVRLQKRPRFPKLCMTTRRLALFSIPLTANRVLVNFANSLEAILIPVCLKSYGYSNSDALSLFGILTGMAMPMILFPSVATGSVSVMLLPSISRANAKKNQAEIHRTVRHTVSSCLVLGFASTLFFFFTGPLIGRVVFANTLSGMYIRTLSFICPFLFLSTTLCSILHGLGYATTTLLLNLSSCLLRILCILLAVPAFGIRAYLYSMLASQLLLALCAMAILNHFLICGSNIRDAR